MAAGRGKPAASALGDFGMCLPAGYFDFEPVGMGVRVARDHQIVFAGTRAAVDKARNDIIALLKTRNLFRPGIPYFDMEPFEALRDIIRNGEFDDVEGPPQIVKVYKNGTSKPFAVKWRMTNGRELSALGRPLFERERTSLPVVDPDVISFLPLKTVEKRLQRAQTTHGGEPDALAGI